MIEQFRISVIIPVFNAAHSLREAVESITLGRSTDLCCRIEVLAVDDASTDTSWRVITELQREALIDHVGRFFENRGPAAARNEALRHATGDLVTFLDADDVRVEGSLIRQAKCLAARPDVDAAIGKTQIERLQLGTSMFVDFGCPALLLYLPSGLFRRELFSAQRCGFFDESYRQSEDTDWFLRARENGVRFYLEEEVVCRYRRHGTNLSTNKSANQRFFFNALRESLRRRRVDGLSAAPLPPWNGIAK